ncbi:MAG: glycosyltransferase family 8 protein [Alphaproteobacteria bacterium]|nr:glycosyltransferase family 8 protein [Alphaproteobacteria bacterium]
MINVVFICDNNYALPTRTAINSLKKTQSSKLCIYVIAVDLSIENINLFNSLSSENITVKVLQKSNEFQNVGENHPYVSKAALFKFFLPSMIKEDKVLYLDGDIIVGAELDDLYGCNIQRYYAAVVKDMAGMIAGHHEKMNHESYFNSGVMLLNLKKMRQENTADKLLKAKKEDVWKHFMDQDTLNLVFAEKVKYLSPKYNFMLGNMLTYKYEQIADFYGVSVKEIMSPVIWHLTNYLKPWDDINSFMSELWLRYVIPEDIKYILGNYCKSLSSKLEMLAQQQEVLMKKQDMLMKKQDMQIQKNSRRLFKCIQQNNKYAIYILGCPIYKEKEDKIYIFGVLMWNHRWFKENR